MFYWMQYSNNTLKMLRICIQGIHNFGIILWSYSISKLNVVRKKDIKIHTNYLLYFEFISSWIQSFCTLYVRAMTSECLIFINCLSLQVHHMGLDGVIDLLNGTLSLLNRRQKTLHPLEIWLPSGLKSNKSNLEAYPSTEFWLCKSFVSLVWSRAIYCEVQIISRAYLAAKKGAETHLQKDCLDASNQLQRHLDSLKSQWSEILQAILLLTITGNIFLQTLRFG